MYQENRYSKIFSVPAWINLLAAFLLLSLPVSAGTIVKDIEFGQAPAILQRDGYSVISLDDATPFISPGKPVIPHLRLNVELPGDAENVKISAIPSNRQKQIIPSPPEFALFAETTDSSPTRAFGKPDRSIYSNNALFPASFAEISGIHTREGRKVAAIRVFPVRVNPVSLEMVFAPSMRIEISFTAPSPIDLKHLPLRASASDFSRTYLIITASSLASAFTPLVTEKTAAGISADVITTDDIYANYTGLDAPAKIRACIADNHANHGTKYVLLGGDASIVPARMIHAEVTQDNVTDTADIPCDLYYACLDGTWDSNNNGKYGESTDGINGGEIDLLPEVYVGRVPAKSTSEIANFLAKNAAAPSRPAPDKALFAGEYLGLYGNTFAYGGRALDEISRLFAGFSITWLDDRPQKPSTAPSWSRQNAIDALDTAPNVVVHSGHGTATTTMGLPASAVHSLSNPYPFLIASSACHIGSFDKTEECFAKGMLVSQYAAFAAQMNTRQGWFIAGYEHAYSSEFMDAFLYYALLERLPLGEAHFKSKEALLSAVESKEESAQVYRWCYLENTLFGDPLATLSLPDPMAVTQISYTNEICISQSELSSEFTFKLTNTSPAPLSISVRSLSELFTAQIENLSVPAVSETNVVISINSDTVKKLAAGVYSGKVCFSNLATSATETFEIAISLIPPPAVLDSVSPANDYFIDFGTVKTGTTKTEHITLSNTSSVPFSVQSIYSANRDLANSPRPTDFIAYDRTTYSLCVFSTDSHEISYFPFSTELDAIATTGRDSESVYALSTAYNAFYRLDLQSLSLRKLCDAVPNLATHMWASLTFNERDGNFYATSVEVGNTITPETTFYIFPTNGMPQITLATVNGNFNSLAIDKSGLFYSIDIDDDILYTVNPVSGDKTAIGDTGIDADYSQALDFDSSGTTLFWSANTDYDASLRIIDTATAENYALFDLPPEYGEQFPPELELAVLPDITPFAATGIKTPFILQPLASSTLNISFSPVLPGAYTNRFSFFNPGSTSPFTTVTCTGSAFTPPIPSVKIVSAGQRWPWNGKVDVSVDAENLDQDKTYCLMIKLLDITGTTTNDFTYATGIEISGVTATNGVNTIFDAKAADAFGQVPDAKIFNKAKLVPVLTETNSNRQ